MKRNNILKSSAIATRSHVLLSMGIFLVLKMPFYSESRNTLFGKQIFADPVSAHRIHEQKFITINGIEQWITIKGEDTSHPVILFLHGGPGSPLSPYSDAIYAKWEKDFILVQWDQRGTGKTYGRNAPLELSPGYLKSNPLTVEQMVTDGTELSQYIIKHLGKQKIILFGTSWGSILGVKMVTKRPDLFYAYVGHSQVVNPSDNLVYDYHKIYKMAQQANDKQAVETLNSIGLPPYNDSPKNAGQLLRIIKKYERENSIPAPESWMKPSAGYDNEKDSQHRYDGDDYSFVNYIGYNRLGIKPMNTINLLKDGLDFKVPVYLIQGENDILTPKEITKGYFKKIRAPQKKLILLPGAAHGFNQSVIDMQYKIMKQYVLPLINQ